MSFSELGISKWLLKTLDDCKILSPTEVQKACIKPTLEGTVINLVGDLPNNDFTFINM